MEDKKARNVLIRTAMPGVAVLVAEKRRRWGDAHVSGCISKGMAGEPGWFFAREGTLAVGTPWADDPAMANFAAMQVTQTQALVFMRAPEPAHGAH